MAETKYRVDNPTTAIGVLATELYKKYGEEVFSVLRPVLRDYGFNVGVKLRKKLADASFSNRVVAWLEPGIKAGVVEIMEKGDARVTTKGTFCPLSLKGSGRAVCENLMAIDEGLVSALADGREIRLVIEKTMAQGDPYCLVTFSIKE
jgi:hypothetical protein